MKKQPLLALVLMLLLGSISCRLLTRTFTPAPSPAPTQIPTFVPVAPATSTLNVEIQYTGQWYRDTFNYALDAPNIRHVVLILPAEVDFDKSAGWIFTALAFAPSPETLALNEEAQSIYGTLAQYLYDAPQGNVVVELAPGTYKLAAAFIAAALPPPGADTTLYPGVTGGGASTEFQDIAIQAGKTLTIFIELTDANGWG